MESWSSDVVVLAGTREVRVLDSTAEAERALAGGFLPSVVLLGAGLSGPDADEFTRRLGADPARPPIPVMAISGDGDRLRLTAVRDDLRPPATTEELACLLEVLEDLCSEPVRLAG